MFFKCNSKVPTKYYTAVVFASNVLALNKYNKSLFQRELLSNLIDNKFPLQNE